jgi:hypothetical protein
MFYSEAEWVGKKNCVKSVFIRKEAKNEEEISSDDAAAMPYRTDSKYKFKR